MFAIWANPHIFIRKIITNLFHATFHQFSSRMGFHRKFASRTLSQINKYPRMSPVINYIYFFTRVSMNLFEKFQKELSCICNQRVLFQIIEDVECDWGMHVLIQCPKCEELFSIDKKCPAFQNISKLFLNNPSLYSKEEESEYLKDSHM